jgi:hypothetical protein
VLAAEPAPVLPGHGLSVHLRRQHVLLAREELCEQLAGQHLALAAVVDVRGVEERDAVLGRAPDDRLRVRFAQRPRPFGVLPEAHHPQADARHAQSRVTEVHVPHARIMLIDS